MNIDHGRYAGRGSGSPPLPSAAGEGTKKQQWTRQRTGTPRSRSGCITCKIRHTKCDEARPFCQRCIKSGFQCDGYGTPAPTQSKKAATALDLAITSYALPFRVPGSQEDRRMLHYFCVQAAEDLSGFLSSTFWNKIVLQRSHDEQVVRQAVIALSAVHLEHATASTDGSGSPTLGASEEIMLQYNKSLRCLRKYLNHANTKGQEPPSLVVILICCALFYCFESARGNADAAMQHLRMGLTMLNDKSNRDRMSQKAQDLEDMFHLEDLFHRLDLQATLYDQDRVPLLDLTTPEERAGIYPVVGCSSTSFATLQEAHAALAKLQNWLLRLLIDNIEYKFYSAEHLPHYVVQQKQVLEEQFAIWSDRFEGFLDASDGESSQGGSPGSTTSSSSSSSSASSSSSSSSDIRSHPSALLALLHYNNALLFLRSSLPFDAEVFDAPLQINPHRDQIEAVLSLSDAVLRASQQPSSRDGSPSPKGSPKSPQESPPPPPRSPGGKTANRRVISAETGVVAPLLFLVIKSGDASVVHRALGLLEAYDRKEGLYDTRISVVIARKMMELNEARLHHGEDGRRMARSLEFQNLEILDLSAGRLDGIAQRLGV